MKGNHKKTLQKKSSNAVKTSAASLPEIKPDIYSRFFGNESLLQKVIITSLVIFMGAGFLLRLLNAGELSFWADEFVHVMRAKNVVNGTGPLFTDDNNGILLTIVMLPLFMLFGTAEWVARFPSVIFSTASVYLVYLLGNRLFGRSVGWIAAALSSVSLYLVYWGRIARNYAIFEFFYLLLLYLLLCTLQETSSGKQFWKKWKIDPKYLLMLLGAFILAFLTHQLIFLFFVGLGFYLIGIALTKIITGQPDRFMNVYFFGGLFSLVVLAFLFLPFLQPVSAVIFESIVYQNLRQFVLPNWDSIESVWNSEDRWASFMVYFEVMEKDMPVLFGYAIYGVLFSLFIRWQSGWFLFCFSMIPFLLLSFVYRDPCDPRYMIFFYPLMLIGIGCFFYFFSFYLFGKLVKKNWGRWVAISVCVLFVVLLFLNIRYKDLYALTVADKKTGFIVDKELSKWTFVDWRNELSYVKSNMQPGDVLMGTNPLPAAYYLGVDSIIWCRQRKLNPVTRKYEDLPTIDTTGRSAHSAEELKETFEKNNRGWLIADYYLQTVFTTDEAREFVWKNMTYHFDASRTGTVQIFSWDHDHPPTFDPDFVFEMGKNDLAMGSQPVMLNMSDPPLGQEPYILLLLEGLDSDKEGYMLINDKERIFFPANSSNKPQYRKMVISSTVLHKGINKIIFYYLPGSADPHPGYVIYKLSGGFTEVPQNKGE